MDLTKVNPWNRLTSLYIISYLHFLKLNNILTLPQTFLFVTEAGFDLTQMHLVFCLPDLNASAYTSFRNQNKCKPSINANFHILKTAYHSLFEWHLQYGTQVWGQKNNEIITFQKLQNCALTVRKITCLKSITTVYSSISYVYKECKILKLPLPS